MRELGALVGRMSEEHMRDERVRGARVMGHKSWARELRALVGFMSKERMRDERARDTRGTTKNVRGKVISPGQIGTAGRESAGRSIAYFSKR